MCSATTRLYLLHQFDGIHLIQANTMEPSKPTITHISNPHCFLLLILSVAELFSAMLEGKALVGETDMLQTMQHDALHLAGMALDLFDVTESTDIARFIKKDFDRMYGPGWQCIVGTNFGSFVTHCHGCFIYFGIGSLTILL